MKFTKFGKALSIGALSVAVVFGVTSCVQSYTVGYLYVTGTVTASTGNNGIISGYKIDHNTGALTTINGLPVSSGGSNPVRAVLTLGSRFLYVLNRGVNGSGNGNCYGTGANACQNANITQFAVGGNGILTPQETFFSQGINPFRMFADSSGSYLFVLDHDCARQREPLKQRQLRARPGLGSHDLRRHYRLQDRPDHRPFVAGCQCAGDGGQRPAAHLLSGPGESGRLCPYQRLRSHPCRRPDSDLLPICRRHAGLPVQLRKHDRPVDAEPEQRLSRWASTRELPSSTPAA